MLPTFKLLSPLLLAMVVGFPTLARGQSVIPACSDLPAPLYGRGGSSLNRVLAKLAPLLAQGDSPRTLVYQDDGPCEGLSSLIDPTQPLSGTAKYWAQEAAGQTATCSLSNEAGPGPTAAFALTAGDVQTLACAGIASLPASIADLVGPVSTLSFVVPRQSTQEVISAEAAYYLYGIVGSAGVAPWSDDEFIFSYSGVSHLVSRALGIPPAALRKNEPSSSAGIVTALRSAVTAGKAEPAIAFQHTSTVDAFRQYVASLAYQQFDQQQGYWPDSTRVSFDKLNVREGRYSLWHVNHLLGRSVGGVLADEGVARLAALLGTDPDQVHEVAGLNAIIEAGEVPRCAMHVWRDEDFGPLYGYAPAAPCTCYFEAAQSQSTCATCQETSECPNATDVCSYGYCEPGPARAP